MTAHSNGRTSPSLAVIREGRLATRGDIEVRPGQARGGRSMVDPKRAAQNLHHCHQRCVMAPRYWVTYAGLFKCVHVGRVLMPLWHFRLATTSLSHRFHNPTCLTA